MSLAYQDTTSKSLSNPSLNTREARLKHLFNTYIARMFKRKGKHQEYDPEQTKQRLSWLARNMQLHNQDVFLIENLQPSWLQTRRWRFAYLLVSRLLGWLIVGLIFGLDVGFVFGGNAGLNVGLMFGLIVGFFDILRFEWLDKWREGKGVSNFWWSIVYFVSIGLIFGLSTGLQEGLFVGLFGGILIGLLVELMSRLRGSRRKLMNDIQAVEALRWYWSEALKGGLIVGVGVGVFGLGARLRDWMSTGLLLGLIFGSIVVVIGGLIFAFFAGLRPEIIETKTTPNQGIYLSAKNAIYVGLIVGVSICLLVVVIGGLIDGWNTWELIGWLFGGSLIGLIVGLVGIFWYGGSDIIKHYTLRLILIIQGHTPRNYARFLDYAVDRIFLQKVGGGYRFIHRMLLEHFAEIDFRDKI